MRLAAAVAVAAVLAAPLSAETLEQQKAAEFTLRLDRKTPAPAVSEAGPVDDGEFLAAGAELPGHIRFEAPVFVDPVFTPGAAAPGRSLGGFRTADRLDSHTDLFTRKLGTRDWDLSVAGDAQFKTAYLRLTRPDERQLHKIRNLSDLRGKGVDIQIDAKTYYNVKVSVNIFSPTRGSKLKITPIRGTRGPSHSIKTGAILDRVREKSFVFKTGGSEFWMLHGTDVDPQTNWFADTRSFLVIHENGLSSKAWPIPEEKLAVGRPTTVELGGVRVVLLRTGDGRLEISEPAAKDDRIALR